MEKKMANLRNFEIFTTSETLDMQSEEVSEGKLTGINEESGYDKR